MGLCYLVLCNWPRCRVFTPAFLCGSQDKRPGRKTAHDCRLLLERQTRLRCSRRWQGCSPACSPACFAVPWPRPLSRVYSSPPAAASGPGHRTVLRSGAQQRRSRCCSARPCSCKHLPASPSRASLGLGEPHAGHSGDPAKNYRAETAAAAAGFGTGQGSVAGRLGQQGRRKLPGPGRVLCQPREMKRPAAAAAAGGSKCCKRPPGRFRQELRQPDVSRCPSQAASRSTTIASTSLPAACFCPYEKKHMIYKSTLCDRFEGCVKDHEAFARVCIASMLQETTRQLKAAGLARWELLGERQDASARVQGRAPAGARVAKRLWRQAVALDAAPW